MVQCNHPGRSETHVKQKISDKEVEGKGARPQEGTGRKGE